MTQTLHAAAVSLRGGALLILGRTGAGKSSLALEMVALGAGLVADDLVRLEPLDEGLVAAPFFPGESQLIEARGLGLLRVRAAGPAPVRLVIDLDRDETERLPPRRLWRLGAFALPLLHRPRTLSAAALLLALGGAGPLDPESIPPCAGDAA